MANKAKETARDRRATVEAMRRQQQARERRKTALFVGVALLLGLALVALAVVPTVLGRVNDPKRKAPAAFGVPAAAAGCEPEVIDEARGAGDHKEEGERVDYPTVPASGAHTGQGVVNPRRFYQPGDRPAVEKLVHSLEHGYTVAWYDPALPEDQRDALRDLAERMSVEPATGPGKFIAAPWTGPGEGRPAMPEGKRVVLAHWGAAPGDDAQAFRQSCSAVSGEAIAAFASRHPAASSPEPQGY